MDFQGFSDLLKRLHEFQGQGAFHESWAELSMNSGSSESNGFNRRFTNARPLNSFKACLQQEFLRGMPQGSRTSFAATTLTFREVKSSLTDQGNLRFLHEADGFPRTLATLST